jgi:hypothetical protein
VRHVGNHDRSCVVVANAHTAELQPAFLEGHLQEGKQVRREEVNKAVRAIPVSA